MPSKWDDLAFVLSDIRWNESEVVEHFKRTLKDNIPSGIMMPVPRCYRCVYWTRFEYASTGRCNRLGQEHIREDFGCVLWKAK